MRVICENVFTPPYEPGMLQVRINELICTAESGNSACRVVGVAVLLLSPSADGNARGDDVDAYLVTLSTTDGPEERTP
jgi:hypothetical protein